MFKSLIAGFLVGIAVTVAAVFYIPAVDQVREASIISVTPNGGNTEAFHIKIPMDRIMIGAPGQPEAVPPGLDWPAHESLAGVRAELFKLRNARDAVVGVASRMAVSDTRGDSIEWVLHFPARGSMFVTMPARSVDGIHRVGNLRSGTDEFLPLSGRMTERWVANESPDDEDAAEGRIELLTMFVGELGPEPAAPVAEEIS